MLAELETEPTELEDHRAEDGDETEVQPFRYAISSYGADYQIDNLVERLRNETIYVPKFQRGFVWHIKDASRFIESLLLGLPVPGIFLSKEFDTGKLLVVDGQQRLLSLRYFYDGTWEPSRKEFRLKRVQPEFEDKTYITLRYEDRCRLNDTLIHAIVFKQDEPSEDSGSVYEVFGRLNTGGKKLTPQEIRSAVHHSGRMRDLLVDLNAYKSWRTIYGPDDLKMRDQELILRFLALLNEGDSYEKPMVAFLNGYMGRNKNVGDESLSAMKRDFQETIDLVHKSIGNHAFRPARALNAAVFDSVMVGTAKRLSKGPVVDLREYKNAYNELLSDPEFINTCRSGTADGERVRTRLTLAKNCFDQVP